MKTQKKLLKNSRQLVLYVLIGVIFSGISFSAIIYAQEESKIPAWIKTAVGFWVNDQISDDEFLKAIEYFVENELIKVDQKTENGILIENLHTLQSEINLKIEQTREVVNLPQIQETIIESNSAYEASGFPNEIIDQVDERWQASDPDEPGSVSYNLINNSAGDVLRSFMDADLKSESQYKYAEIFVTNQYGANVAQSHKTSDFKQNDELWWQKAKQNGLFLSEGGYDESAGVYSTDIAIKIFDEEGNFIGILKAVIDIESVTEN